MLSGLDSVLPGNPLLGWPIRWVSLPEGAGEHEVVATPKVRMPTAVAIVAMYDFMGCWLLVVGCWFAVAVNPPVTENPP